MPNWCMNNLTITHNDPAKLQEFCDAYNSGGVCNCFIPQPKDLNEKDCFAQNGWYTWRCNNWGTKWDFGKSEHDDPAQVINNEVSISFDTAWSPPIQFYEKLVELGYNVKATYWEPGMGFCGIWDNGYDNYIEYSDAEKPEEVIPVALWNDYNMDEFFEATEEV